ncbi:armadillo-type protein [Pisolithus orientalis]|uniref:armadillo-type protein n=1 Tax=Pisolithus orientalis TaxID=936130 RepID=UPI00222596B5|nr:armadillo-type protein [Pisolithus orientalis]KAI6004365.1 armadillo-type protein [Pisolithus orientalis]
MPAQQKNSKKRTSVSEAGPTAKKLRLTPSTTREEIVKKRKQPVTLPVSRESDDESSDESDEDQVEDIAAELEDEDDNGDEDTGGGAGEMSVDAAGQKDPNAARESHKVQRALHEQRKAAKPHSQLLVEAKRVWSLARQKNIPPAERQQHVRDLMKIVEGKVKDIVLKHDASRIIQTIVKYGGRKERDQIASELKGHFKQLAEGKYSKFLVSKLIRHCTAHRESILSEFQGYILRLLLHREASRVLADAFELYANAYERSILLRDFYGKEITLFSTNRGTEADKEKAKRGLQGVLEGIEGDRKKRTLSAVKENLTTIFNNPDKGTVTHAIVHRALWEYLATIHDVEDESEREKLRREIFESCQDVLAETVHTKDGSRAVREFLAFGTAKDRKHIIKVIKPHIARMCVDDEAQLVIFTALDVIDDTKLTAKSLVSDITSSAETFVTTPQGRRSLFYLLVPRTRRHFTPAQIAIIAETDSIREKTSKKDSAVRSAEIRQAASPSLLKFVEEKGAEVARDTGGSLAILEIMLHAEGDKSAAISALIQPLASTYPSDDPSRLHPIDLPHTSRMYKSLLQGGHFSRSTKVVERTTLFSPAELASAFLSTVDKETTLAMAQGNGAFVVAELLQRIQEECSDESKKKVKRWFSKSFVSNIRNSEVRGKDILIEKILALS